MPLGPGEIVGGRYSIQESLGAGGTGAVYRAWDTRLSAPVALKGMVRQPGLSPQAPDGLRLQHRREAPILANVDHPRLVDVLDFFEERGNAYRVMRFDAGEPFGIASIISGAAGRRALAPDSRRAGRMALAAIVVVGSLLIAGLGWGQANEASATCTR